MNFCLCSKSDEDRVFHGEHRRPSFPQQVPARLAALFLTSLLSLLGGCAATSRETNTLVIPQLPASIQVQVDGRLDEPCYQSSHLVSRFQVASQPKIVPQPTRTWLFWNPAQLVFAFQVTDTNVVAAPETGNEAEVGPQDRAEIFLWSGRATDPYYCFEMGAMGAVLDNSAWFGRRLDYAWTTPGLKVKTTLQKDGYLVEGTLSKAALGSMGIPLTRGTRFRCGLFRADYETNGAPKPTWICWVDSGRKRPDFHIPQSFGQAILGSGPTP